jgi:MerR family transcriptional regulator, thiopeptide resistance regulator
MTSIVQRQEAELARTAQFITAGETAALLGVSSKALRVYERHGLVTPDRSRAGYRVYGPDQIRRLHQALALKSLGLSLARIGECLAGLGDSLGPILAAQESDLKTRVATLQSALAAVSAARRRLEQGGSLSVDELATLTKEIVMTEAKANWRDNMDALFSRHFTETERQAIVPTPAAPANAADAAEREALLAEAEALLGTDPGAPAALDLAKRWRDRAVKFTGGNPAMLLQMRAAFDQALANPEIAKTLPWREEMAFIKAATERLEALGR